MIKVSYSKIYDEIKMFSKYQLCNTVDHYLHFQDILEKYGINNFIDDMKHLGWITEDNKISDNDKPFNPFARMITGKLIPPYGMTLLENAGPHKHCHVSSDIIEETTRYFIAKNKPEFDLHWNDFDDAWIGKASMSRFHQFLIPKSLDIKYFNALFFGFDLGRNIRTLESIRNAINELIDMIDIATKYANYHSITNVGLFFHCYPFNSVHLLHMHILDMDHLGPTYHKLLYNNMSAYSILESLQLLETKLQS